MHAEDFVAISALTHLRPSSFITSISLQPIDTSSHSPTSVSMSITQWNLLKVTSDLFCTIAKRRFFLNISFGVLAPFDTLFTIGFAFLLFLFLLLLSSQSHLWKIKKVYKMVPCTNRHWCLVNWWWGEGTKKVVVYWVGGGVRRRFHE